MSTTASWHAVCVGHDMEIAMKLKAPVVVGLLLGSSLLCAIGFAGEHSRPAPARQAPPPFRAHAPGVHPRGATVRQHELRVLAPRSVVHGHSGWQHWDHPEFPRPAYYWDWAGIHTVTCIAEDSYGDQYPVSEAAAPGFALGNMTGVEDDALDRCYAESGQDTTCVLLTCTHI
ncbi:MAG: hypothetical protein ABSF69_19425 [Polyangiaceae bacterium]